jgi:multiple sugar transport system substrate-binding protein
MSAFPTPHARLRDISRRRFLALTAAAAGSAALAGCGSGSGSGTKNLTLSSWNIPTDLESYKKIAATYTKAHPDVTTEIQVTASGNFNEWFSSRLAAGNAPDVLRMAYQDIGTYVGKGGLVNLSEFLPQGYGDAFLPAYWATVAQHDGIYGLPQHTDGWGIYLNTSVMSQIGVEPPQAIEEAWGWDTFISVAREVKKATGQNAFSWFFSGPITGWRWLPVLYMHGGKLVDLDSMAPAIDSPEGVEAIEWSRTWYAEGLMSPSNTIKGSQVDTAPNLFVNKQVGMMICSDFQMNTIKGKLPDEQWTVAPLFKDVTSATNMGGNALVITKSADDPAAAEKFAEFVCNPENMTSFCEQSAFVPVREDLVGKDLQWVYRPELMKIFAANAATLSPEVAKLQSLPQFGSINQVLSDQLDLCWTGQQSSADTAKKISEGIKTALAS